MSHSAIAIAIFSGLFFLLAILILWSFVFRSKSSELEFYSEATIIFSSAAICILIIVLFLYFRENSIKIPSGLGQMGDFIGGLTNPILSFVALIVLLRSTTIQTKIIKSQQEAQALEGFRSEFYKLLDNISKSSERMNGDDQYVSCLLARHNAERVIMLELATSGDIYEVMAKRFVINSIEFKAFERYAISIRMAMHHLVVLEPKGMYQYALIIRDSMTVAERIIFLNWIYYYWPHARNWFIAFIEKDGARHPYEYTRGLKAEDFISDEVYKFFSS